MRVRVLIILGILPACVSHLRVSRDALRFPPASEDGPVVVRAVDDDGRERDFEIRPDARFSIHAGDRRIEARARDLWLTEDALIVDRDGRRRAIPWERVRGAEISEPRPWLAFAVAVGAGALVAGALWVGDVAP